MRLWSHFDQIGESKNLCRRRESAAKKLRRRVRQRHKFLWDQQQLARGLSALEIAMGCLRFGQGIGVLDA